MEIKSIEELGNLFLDKLKSTLFVDLSYLLKAYEGLDWRDYVLFTDSGYNKIIITETKLFHIFITCWKKGQSTEIHDHPSHRCMMKVLEGSIEEHKYDNVDDPQYIETFVQKKGEIGFRFDNSLLHKITAPENAITLHVCHPIV